MDGDERIAGDTPLTSGQPPQSCQPSGWRIVPVTIVTLAAAAALLNLAAPGIQARMGTAAGELVSVSITQTGDLRQAGLGAANLLAPGNRAAASVTALDQARSGAPGRSLETLARVGDGSGSESAYQVAVIAASLEAGRTVDAVRAADAVVGLPDPGDEALVYAGLAYGAGDKSSQAGALAARVSALEARRSLLGAAAGELTLARELQASGLYISSSEMLKRMPSSVARDILLARALEARGATDDLRQATALYRQAADLDVTNREARTGLVQTLAKRGQAEEASRQQAILDRLDAGKP